MSTISGVSSTGSAWPDISTRASARSERMFAKVDADGNGGVDKSELQTMLDDISKKSGKTLGSADDLMTKMDSNGDGSLSKDELAAGMKSLMPRPASTVQFAQRGAGGPPPECPPPDGASASGTSSTSTDPLDTNGDGVVSAEERMAGELKDVMKDLFAAADTDRDKSISPGEADTFKQKLNDVFDKAIQGIQTGSDTASTGSQTEAEKQSSGFSLSSFITEVLKQYSQTASASSTTSSPSISVAA